jgi:ABC-type dipeptide/oligopeptide/nickel transport system permease component
MIENDLVRGTVVKALQNRNNLWLWVVGEIAGIILLIGFVVGLASMPPLQVVERATSMTGFAVKLDTAQWNTTMATYWKTVKTGSLGIDYKKRPVGPLVLSRLGNSMKLVGVAVLLAIGLGIPKGFWDFNQMRKKGIALGPILTGAVQGVPDFWLILLIQLGAAFLYNRFGWTPFKIGFNSEDPINSMVYPVLSLALIPGAYMARITSTAMNNVYEKEYIRTARSKGLHEIGVIYKHALRNALVQILDGLPSVAGVMVSNLLIVEYLFNFPGLTTLLKLAISPPPTFVGSVRTIPPTDVPTLVAAGVALGVLFSALYVTINILRRIADPRLKERG